MTVSTRTEPEATQRVAQLIRDNGGTMTLRQIVEATPDLPWGKVPSNFMRYLVRDGTIVSKGGGHYTTADNTTIPAAPVRRFPAGTVYVVLGHTVEQKDSLCIYAGTDKAKAEELAATADEITYYTQMETWVNGERTE